MKWGARFSYWTAASAFIVMQPLCIYANAPLRRPISVDNPLIIPFSTWPGDGQFLNNWNAIPDDLKPYCAVNCCVEYGPANSDVESFVSLCEQNAIPIFLQNTGWGQPIYDCDGSFGASMFDKYPHFLGYQWSEFDGAGISWTDACSWPCIRQELQVCADKGGLLMLAADNSANHYNILGQCGDLMNALRNAKDNAIILNKSYTDMAFDEMLWDHSECVGDWLTGYFGNWGLSADSWIFACATPWNETCQVDSGGGGAAPAGIQGMEMGISAAYGATVYIKFECMTQTMMNKVVYPALRKIINSKMIPTLSEVKAKIHVGFKYAGTMDEHALLDGLYLQKWWMPNNGRYYIIPVFPQVSADADINFCDQVALNQFSSTADRQAYYNQRYPDDGITGDSWVTPFRDKGYAYFANPNETNQDQITSNFTFPLQRNSCESLSATLPSYTSGTIEESANEVAIYVGNSQLNYFGEGTQTRTTTFVLQGKSEPDEPVLTISGQDSYTKNWNAGAQTYTLNVVHNGPVTISLATGASTATAHDVKLSHAQLSAHMNGRSLFVSTPELCTINLIDFSGRTIVQKSLCAGEKEIALSKLRAGMYALRISDKSGKHISQRLMVQ